MPHSAKTDKPKIPHRKDAAAAARALQALELRKAGVTYGAIAKQCGYASGSGAYQAVQRELQRCLQEPADNLRRMEAERLNDLYRAIVPKALKGDTWSVDRCLKIMERRAQLLGLDARPDAMVGAQMSIIPIESKVYEAI